MEAAAFVAELLLLLVSDPELAELPELDESEGEDELVLVFSAEDEPLDSPLFAAADDEPLLELFDASRLSLR